MTAVHHHRRPSKNGSTRTQGRIDRTLLLDVVEGLLLAGSITANTIISVAVEESVSFEPGETWREVVLRLVGALAARGWTCRGPATLSMLALIAKGSRERRSVPVRTTWSSRRGDPVRTHAGPPARDPDFDPRVPVSDPSTGGQQSTGIGDSGVSVDERARLLRILRCVVTHLVERGELLVDDVLEVHVEEKLRGDKLIDPARLLVRVLERARACRTGLLSPDQVLAQITAAVRFRPAPDGDTEPK